jgi:hypothetical protein
VKGCRLPDTRFGDLPLELDVLKPGDYWKYLNDDGSPTEPYINLPEKQLAGNLNRTVWGYCSPSDGGIGTLMIHTVREEKDGTISVRPGDGSSNSIMYNRGRPEQWHGYIEHGVWNKID